MKKIRVLIVDDSATMRQLLTEALQQAPDIDVVGCAPEPAIARDLIKQLNPDVLTLDIEMPNMSGLAFLEKIMRLRPMPVIMVSTLTRRGADATLDALALGAVDCLAKPSLATPETFRAIAVELISKIRAAAQAQVHPLSIRSATTPAQISAPSPPFARKLIAIGASTGGVEALITILSHFPQDCPPTVITQHMPAGFTSSFARRLDRLCAPDIAEASDGAELKPNHIYLAPGGLQHLEVEGRSAWRCRLVHGEAMSGHRPSVDRLFLSVARSAGDRAIAALLTGMGSDGAMGLGEIRKSGGQTLGQDQASSTVYGMPRVAAEQGAVMRQLPLNKIGPALLKAALQKAEAA